MSQQMRNCVCHHWYAATTGRQPVTSLTTFVSAVRFLIEIMLILTAIKSHSKMAYDKQTLTLMVIQMKLMKLAKGSFHKFHMKCPFV